jgi:hypothetical protein
MDWDKLKENEDQKQDKKVKIAELKEHWKQLDEECTRKYLQFEVETEDVKQAIEDKAVDGFKKYFESKDFKVIGDNKSINAKYNDVNIVFGIFPEGHAFTIHFYVGQLLRDCKVFDLQLSKEFDGKYKQLLVEEIGEKATVEFAEKQVQALEHNKRSIDTLLADKDKIKFVFELDSHHSGMSGQFESIEAILETIK